MVKKYCPHINEASKKSTEFYKSLIIYKFIKNGTFLLSFEEVKSMILEAGNFYKNKDLAK